MAVQSPMKENLQYLKGVGELMMMHRSKFALCLMVCPDGKVDCIVAAETLEVTEIDYAINTFLETWQREDRTAALQKFKDRKKQ